MSQTNFLIGRGEMLTHDIPPPKRKGNKAEVYTFSQAVQRLKPQFQRTATDLGSLRSEACPEDFGVALLTMNPSYIAKSFFPSAFLRTAGLEAVGSRTVKITPAAWAKKNKPSACTTTELFVAGKRQAFKELKEFPNRVEQGSKEALDFAHIESFSAFPVEARIVNPGSKTDKYFEVGLHLVPDMETATIQRLFIAFGKKIDAKVYFDLGFTAGNLWFVPVKVDSANVKKLAEFVFVRVIRPIPKLRAFRPFHISDAKTQHEGQTVTGEERGA